MVPNGIFGEKSASLNEEMKKCPKCNNVVLLSKHKFCISNEKKAKLDGNVNTKAIQKEIEQKVEKRASDKSISSELKVEKRARNMSSSTEKVNCEFCGLEFKNQRGLNTHTFPGKCQRYSKFIGKSKCSTFHH